MTAEQATPTTEWVRHTDDFHWHRVVAEIDPNTGGKVPEPVAFLEEGHSYRAVHSACDRTIVEHDPQGFLAVATPDDLPRVATEWPFAGESFGVCEECAVLPLKSEPNT